MPIIRPKISVLDDEHKKLIIGEAKSILGNQGVFIENQQAIEMFEQRGLNHEGARYLFPPDLIDKCLDSVPHQITLFDRDGEEHITLKDDQVHFDPGSAAIFILDENTGKIRDGQSKDFIRFSKVVEQLKYIDAQSTALIYQDVPKNAQDWHRLYLALSNCYKPIVTGTFRKESFSIMKEILLACRTSEDDLARKPLAIFDACPSPPLKWSDLTTQSLIDAAKSMIPSEFVSMPLAGASAPITLIGSITQHCAECLAGVVIVQLAKEGAPLIWGGSPAVFDMKYGTTPMGAIETMMINLGDLSEKDKLKVVGRFNELMSEKGMILVGGEGTVYPDHELPHEGPESPKRRRTRERKEKKIANKCQAKAVGEMYLKHLEGKF